LNATNRAIRRQRERQLEEIRERRLRRSDGVYSPAIMDMMAAISIDPVTDDLGDSAFVSALKLLRARELGLPAVSWSQGAVFLVAKRRITGERLGCVAVTVMPPSTKALIEDFLVVPGRWGKVAAFAMMQRLLKMKVPKVAFVLEGNTAMQKALTAHGMRVTGYIMEV
jgi:hypothetical protein